MKTNNTFYLYKKIKQITGLLIYLFLLSGCEDYLEVNDPFGQIPPTKVFDEEATANSAVTTLYAKLRDEVLVTGTSSGLGVLMGLHADELDLYGLPGQPIETFYNHQIISSNGIVKSIWNSSYNLIYMSNSILEGLDASQSLTDEVKRQLRGEALFVRALTHFYLVNLYGDIPYVTTTNFEANSKVSRLQVNLIYENILTDLNKAKTLLGDNYVSNERIRANRWVVSALLARVYLYNHQWEEAEVESNSIINNTSLFNLEANVEKEFLKESRSAILQLKTKNAGNITAEASTLKFSSWPPPFVALNKNMVETMEDSDLRRNHWIAIVTDGTRKWYYSNKYKQQTNTGISLEYSIVFRLAEQYLIRAEARAMLNNITGSLQDINTIRRRAGLNDITAISTEELIKMILKERRFELFMEHGHRWFDVKRLGYAGEILAPYKSGWNSSKIILPIPESELLMNPNLNPQNEGY